MSGNHLTRWKATIAQLWIISRDKHNENIYMDTYFMEISSVKMPNAILLLLMTRSKISHGMFGKYYYDSACGCCESG